MAGRDSHPIGMHGLSPEVEAHINHRRRIAVENLRQCVQSAGVEVPNLCSTPWLRRRWSFLKTERQMGAIVCDIGGGTTDLAVYNRRRYLAHHGAGCRRQSCHSDIAHGLRLAAGNRPNRSKFSMAMHRSQHSSDEIINVKSFGQEGHSG